MADMERQTAGGKVLWHVTMSLDGCVAGPSHAMDWMAGSPTPGLVGRQLLELDLIDEIDLHIAPVLLGNGTRLFGNPGGTPIRLDLVNGEDPTAAVSVRYRPNRRGQEVAQ